MDKSYPVHIFWQKTTRKPSTTDIRISQKRICISPTKKNLQPIPSEWRNIFFYKLNFRNILRQNWNWGSKDNISTPKWDNYASNRFIIRIKNHLISNRLLKHMERLLDSLERHIHTEQKIYSYLFQSYLLHIKYISLKLMREGNIRIVVILTFKIQTILIFCFLKKRWLEIVFLVIRLQIKESIEDLL